MGYRIHITGAAGAGVSTLGQKLSRELDLPLLDTDDYYWKPTKVPFTEKRTVPERLDMMRAAQPAGGWIVAGSLMGWGEELVQNADLVIFIYTPHDLRMHRLKARETRRYGSRIAEGGDMYLIHECFMGWASRYDDPCSKGRSLTCHNNWLDQMGLPVLRLDGQRGVSHMARQTLSALIPPIRSSGHKPLAPNLP
ncbi:adenylate kinase [Donghicola sp. C2-DW-16]|uniref:Adenylate kinase n=1 Tax=Donghicola mangrovi TaxID=2729614 RepID=A0ABX2PG22_9RHOB|nr:adenylate kinase [Donghicola mangrovi]NVO27737.1 adenylate kinase [Donghicola mangrovi]